MRMFIGNRLYQNMFWIGITIQKCHHELLIFREETTIGAEKDVKESDEDDYPRQTQG